MHPHRPKDQLGQYIRGGSPQVKGLTSLLSIHSILLIVLNWILTWALECLLQVPLLFGHMYMKEAYKLLTKEPFGIASDPLVEK